MTLTLRFDWPDEIPGLGPRTVGPVGKCVCGCGDVVAARYGDKVLCLRHAKEEAIKAKHAAAQTNQ